MWDEGSALGLLDHADGGEGFHPARSERIDVDIVADAYLGATMVHVPFHTVQMGERTLTIRVDPNQATTNALIIQWKEAGVFVHVWSEKVTELEALQYLSTLSVF